jgi:predicted nucleic acid-binding Zn finger protein
MTREESGNQIFNEGRVINNNNNTFGIRGKNYIVTSDACTCPDFKIRQVICKHIFAVRLYIISTGYKPKQMSYDAKFNSMIEFIACKGNIIGISALYDKYDDLVDEAVDAKIIQQGARQFILLV